MKKKSKSKSGLRKLSSRNPINLALARRVVKVVDAGLTFGVGEPKPGQMCVEAAVCYAMGMPHGDQPKCVHPAVTSFKISANDDGDWKSDKDRAKGLRRIAVAQLGSNKIKGSFPAALRVVMLQRKMPDVIKEVLTGESSVHEAIDAHVPWVSDFRQLQDASGAPTGGEETMFAVEVGIDALRLLGSPGVKLMDKLIAEGVL